MNYRIRYRKRFTPITLLFVAFILSAVVFLSGCKSRSGSEGKGNSTVATTAENSANASGNESAIGTMEAIKGQKKYVTVGPEDAMKLIEENKGKSDFVILDVRTPSEYSEGHIANSMLLNFYEPDFQDKLNQLDKNKRYLIYCRSGSRSGRTLKLMEKLKFREVYNLSGGIINWKSKKLPLEKK